jgi:hypothetical protein
MISRNSCNRRERHLFKLPNSSSAGQCDRWTRLSSVPRHFVVLFGIGRHFTFRRDVGEQRVNLSLSFVLWCVNRAHISSLLAAHRSEFRFWPVSTVHRNEPLDSDRHPFPLCRLLTRLSIDDFYIKAENNVLAARRVQRPFGWLSFVLHFNLMSLRSIIFSRTVSFCTRQLRNRQIVAFHLAILRCLTFDLRAASVCK